MNENETENRLATAKNAVTAGDFADAWKKGLKNWITLTTKAKDQIRALSEYALFHFHEHGDVHYIAELLDAVDQHGKNYVRAAALKKWYLRFSPLGKTDGKYHKVSGAEWPEDWEKAFTEPFWDFAPDPEADPFTAGELMQRLNGVIKQYENEQRHVPADENAVAFLGKAKRSVLSLAGSQEVSKDTGEVSPIKDAAATKA